MTSRDPESAAPLSNRDAYLAMYHFVKAYFERGGRRDDGMIMLVTNLRPKIDPSDPQGLWTDDPAFWDDWLRATKVAREQGVPSDSE